MSYVHIALHGGTPQALWRRCCEIIGPGVEVREPELGHTPGSLEPVLRFRFSGGYAAVPEPLQAAGIRCLFSNTKNVNLFEVFPEQPVWD